MDQPFSHPAGEKLLSEARQLFETKPVFHRREKPFVFVCGGSTRGRSRMLRRQFLDWAGRKLPQVILVLAEDAYGYTELYDPPETVNLSDFEGVVGEVADCIVLFPESPGSFAELGLFSRHVDIRGKTLVVNSLDKTSDDSFINLGPIATIDEKSYLRPAIPIKKSRGTADFSGVRKRLARVVRRSRRKRFTYNKFARLDLLDRFLAVLEVIYLMQLLSLDDLDRCVSWIFSGFSRQKVRPILSLLLGMKFVGEKDGYYFLGVEGTSLLEFEGVQIENFRMNVKGHYQKNFPDLWKKLRRVSRAR
jgi:hypothetical protein